MQVRKRPPKPPPPEPEPVTWHPGVPSDKQRKLVELLTAGYGLSLNGAMRHAHYGRHRPSLDQLLQSPTVVDLFRDAIEAGRTLPPKFADRILQAVAEADVERFK